MAVMLGINPITWTNDDVPELGGDTPLEVCLSEARQAGFAGIELGGKFPRSAAALKPILREHGLELISGWYDGRCCERPLDEEFDSRHAASGAAAGNGLDPCRLRRYLVRPPRRDLGTHLSPADAASPRNGRTTAASSPCSPSAWPSSA